VLPHPVSGRKILFVTPSHSTGFVGIDPDERERLVTELYDFAVQDRFIYLPPVSGRRSAECGSSWRQCIAPPAMRRRRIAA
jgi:hypothetical protein